MKVTRLEVKEYNPVILQCWIGVRYWEDSTFNGVDDNEDGDLMKKYFPVSSRTLSPCFVSHEEQGEYPVRRTMDKYQQDFFFLMINLNEGKVIDWPNGVHAQFHYKSCDVNYFRLLDKDSNVICQTPGNDTEYMIGPDFMNEWGDYFVLEVNEDGTIEGWNDGDMQHELQNWVDEINNNA